MKIKVHEIYFDDLTEEAKKRILDFYEYKTVEEGNFDVLPLAILEWDQGEEIEEKPEKEK